MSPDRTDASADGFPTEVEKDTMSCPCGLVN